MTTTEDKMKLLLSELTVSQLHQELRRRLLMIDELLNHEHDDSGECSGCAVIVCPFFDPLHFHHDGCPSCAVVGQAK